jgi:hypothetical protein
MHITRRKTRQITVGKLHPEEEDPFPDGQSGPLMVGRREVTPP